MQINMQISMHNMQEYAQIAARYGIQIAMIPPWFSALIPGAQISCMSCQETWADGASDQWIYPLRPLNRGSNSAAACSSHLHVRDLIQAPPCRLFDRVAWHPVMVTVNQSRTLRLTGMVILIGAISTRNTGIHRIKKVCAADVFIWVDQTFGKDESKPKGIFLY